MAEDSKPLSGPGTALPDDVEQAPQYVYFVAPQKKNYGVRWLTLWQDESSIGVSMTELAKMERPLTQTEYRVRDWLMGTIGLGNYVYVNQAEMARDLRITKANASRAIKRLVELDLLKRGPKSGRSNTYMVNPAFCWLGNLGDGVKERTSTIKTKARVINFEKALKRDEE